MNINVIAFSDTHGFLPEVGPFDLLLLPGDISPVHDHYPEYQLNWLNNDFAQWINKLPFKNEWSKVVLTWGNHDFVGSAITKNDIKHFNKITNNRVVILKNEEYDFEYPTDNGTKSLKIFATPYCKVFGYWAFMVSDESLERYFSFIPENCDILISHDAPDINNLGLISMGEYSGINAGNKILANVIKEKKPKIALCGHIHSGNHNFENVDGTWMANVSYVDEKYKPSHDMLNFIINGETKELVF